MEFEKLILKLAATVDRQQQEIKLLKEDLRKEQQLVNFWRKKAKEGIKE
ncbi:hypothetical protein [Oceanobacillus arenosus]|nr:hypothetical protein [Oceanobacillus arenosus]